MKFDLHLHSKYSSDGGMEPKYMIKIAKKRGLKGIAVTDHNTITGGLKAKKFASPDFDVIVGSEVMTDRGELIGIFLDEEIKSRNYIEVIDEIKDQNGIAIIPHPFDSLRKSAFFPSAKDAKIIKFIEGYNARCFYQHSNETAMKFAKSHGIDAVAGSDAHFGNEIGRAGIITSEEDPRKALKSEFHLFYSTGLLPEIRCLINHSMTKSLKTWKKWKPK